MKSFIKIIFLLVIVFQFNKISLSTPLNTFIDNVNPKQNAIHAIKSANIQIEFTQDMDPNTINNSTIIVFGMQTGKLSTSIIYNAGSKKVIINPDNDFKVGEIITVCLTSGIKTISNTPIIQFVYKFTVQALGGSGTFTKTSLIDTSSFYGGAFQGQGISSGDIDRDGDLDLVIGDRNYLKVYKNDGTANFTFYSSITIDDGDPKLGDFDNDGDLDLLIKNFIYINNGFGNFTLLSSHMNSIGEIGDLNGDGLLDIVCQTGNFLFTLKNLGGTFSIDTTIHLPTGQYGTLSVPEICIEDMNQDGSMEILTVHYGYYDEILWGHHFSRVFQILNNNGMGIFTISSIYEDGLNGLGGVRSAYYGVLSIDANNDGLVDVISPFRKLLNNGMGNFSISFLYAFDNLSGDFNADGSIDVASTSTSPYLAILRNDGLGNFSTTNSANYFFSSNSSAGDFDDDGDIDIATIDYPAQAVSILLNNNCQNQTCAVTGENEILSGSSDNLYLSNTNTGFWEISNLDTAEAFIQNNSTGDSVLVNAGNVAGVFKLFFQSLDSCGGTSCEKQITVISKPLELNLTSLIEGLYYPGAFSYHVPDTIQVYLRQVSSPFSIEDSTITVLNSLGNASASFQSAQTGTYYIIIKHRNSLETWANSGEFFENGMITNFDFTSNLSQAYGNNLKLKGTNQFNMKYCNFSGDVNQNGYINLTDIILVYNDAVNFVVGYKDTDINGDNFTDLTDVNIIYNNASNFVRVKRP